MSSNTKRPKLENSDQQMVKLENSDQQMAKLEDSDQQMAKLDEVPLEILDKIFKFLEPSDILLNKAMVSFQ